MMIQYYEYKFNKEGEAVMTKKIILPIAGAIIIGGALIIPNLLNKDKAITIYTTEKLTRGTVASTISASGTLEPEELIDVGAQVSGQIISFGTDTNGNVIDYRSTVTNGMVLAKLDDVTYIADLEVAQASYSNAVANVTAANAAVQQAEARLWQAEKDWNRAQKIGVGPALSQSAFDSYEASYKIAVADKVAAEAKILQADAQVVQAKANVEKAERNLGYCTISSPVDGIVIDRRVNLGQTVVSSMSVSSMFLVAKELDKMQIWAAVNEADVGSIKEGMSVSFSVDSFPGKIYSGTVKRIRYNATITSNVVTYTVEIDVDNKDMELIPYLTANVLFEIEKAENALIIPARAIRWKPEGAPAAKLDRNEALVHVKEANGNIRPIKVKVLFNNGTTAAIEAPELNEGMELITSSRVVENSKMSKAEEGNKNPFMPSMPKPKKGAGSPPPRP